MSRVYNETGRELYIGQRDRERLSMTRNFDFARNFHDLDINVFTIIGASMEFDEDLPPSCPPTDCSCEELEGVYRVLQAQNPTAYDWLSHMRRGLPRPQSVDECRWASLSLQANKAAVKKLLKLPNFRAATHAAVLDIPQEAGVFRTNRNHHDFWQGRAANMNDYVVDIVDVKRG